MRERIGQFHDVAGCGTASMHQDHCRRAIAKRLTGSLDRLPFVGSHRVAQ